MYRLIRWIPGILVFLWLIPTAAAQTGERCFSETGFCIAGRIRTFWEQNGGLPVFGFPIGPEQDMMIEGKVVRAQNFERNRLELHPENRPPFDVLLGRLGADRLAQQGRDWFAFPKSNSQSGCRFFAETGHNICGDFLAVWRANGLELDGRRGKTEAESLALFGLPLSDVVTEMLGDGKSYQVQWFERARLELHPENAPPNRVLLGLLGNEMRDASSAVSRPLPPPSFNGCREDPDPDAAPDYPVRIVSVDKRGETVTLQNTSQAPVSLDGWTMCSIKGNQQHPIGGVLNPGESKVFGGPADNIWNNSERDDGSLYNQNGQLVSYYRDTR